MKGFFSVLLFLFLIFQSVFADKKTSTPVGPGIIFHHEVRDAGPWQLFVLEIEKNNPWLQFECVKAGDRLRVLEKTSSMAARKDSEGHRIIGAINADFFEISGMPVGAQIIDGMLLKRPIGRSVFAIGDNNSPRIDIFSFRGKVIGSDKSSTAIYGVNEARTDNTLIVYNKFTGSSTGTNQWGTEVVTELISATPVVNDTMWMHVTDKDSTMDPGSGNNPIPVNGLVLSGHGTAGIYLSQHVFLGDTVGVVLEFLPDEGCLWQLVGGTPRIIRNGSRSVEYAQEGINASFASDRHPRTAVGINADSSSVYYFVVDGRQTGYSVGMSLYELADYMMEWGVFQGVNLDGGGSSTMVVRGNVVNSPSDPTGERSVANALMIVSDAPTSPLEYLRTEPATVFLLTGEQLRFSANGFDQYYNPISIIPDSLTWSCDAHIGQIASDGTFTAGNSPDSGYVHVKSGSVKDSSAVYVTTLSVISLEPNPVILKVGEKQQISAKAFDTYQNPVNLTPADYQWQVTGSIGTITNTGLFTATATGSGVITATYGTVTGETAVSVGVSTEIMLDDFSSTARWTLTGLRIELGDCSFTTDATIHYSAPASGRLDYALTTGGTSALYLDCMIPVSGSPTAVSLMVYGDGKAHWLRAEFQDADGERFLINLTEDIPGIDWVNRWQELKIPLEDAIAHWDNPGAVMNFPLTWKRIYLAEADETKKDSGIIYLDDFKAHYITTDILDKSINLPRHFRLEQNFPNPFNPETTIRYSIPRAGKVQIELFNIHGQKIRSLVDSEQPAGTYQLQWKVQNLSSSVYFYRLRFDDRLIATRKMVVLK